MWDFKNADFDLFRNILSNAYWDFIDVSNDINHITDVFTEKFMEPAKIAIPNSVMSGVNTSFGCITKLENKFANVDEYIDWLSE